MTVEERLEVPVRRRDPGPFLDLERQLAARGPVSAGRDDDDRSPLSEAASRGLGDVRPIDAGCDERSDSLPEVAVDGSTREVRSDGGRCHERAQVADGVAPALVELTGLDDDIRERRARRAAGDR